MDANKATKRLTPDEQAQIGLVDLFRTVFTEHNYLRKIYKYDPDPAKTQILIVPAPVNEELGGLFDERPSIVVKYPEFIDRSATGGSYLYRFIDFRIIILPNAIDQLAARRLSEITRLALINNIGKFAKIYGIGISTPKTLQPGQSGAATVKRKYITYPLMVRSAGYYLYNVEPLKTETFNVNFEIADIK